MKEDKSIALLNCFFGRLPWYFEYFIHSCKYNPTIDFIIITDDTFYNKILPKNVTLLFKTLKEVNSLATLKLGIPTNINNGYKLCDFKPAYGVIFSELLIGYDFWGHTDIDIVFGDIREFITDKLLESHELLSVRPDWLTGCFLLYQNTDKINLLYTFSKDYIKVFGSSKHYCFDETNFAHEAFTEGIPYNEIHTEIESMMHVVKKLEKIKLINPYFDLHIIEGQPGKLTWEMGKMYYRNKYEILLYHLIHFKKHYSPRKPVTTIPVKFHISPKKIYY